VRILRSYRWRRRLLFCALVVGIATPLIYLGVHYSTPGDPGNPSGPAVAGGPSYAEPKPAPFTARNQRAVRRVLRDFIRSAVVRHDVGRSWAIAGPSLKEGVTRKQWNRGDIPVVPYPAANRGLGKWSYVEYSYAQTVGLEVFLFPKPGSGYSALTADVELVQGRDRRWRVDYWMPKRFHGPPAVAAKQTTRKAGATVASAKAKAKAQRPERRAAPPAFEPPKPSRAWWLLPIGLLSLIVVVPLATILVIWYRNRSAERAYLRSTGRR
jgi:hypothetical protein